MPSASEAARSQMEAWFGDHISDEGPIKFLQRPEGYYL